MTRRVGLVACLACATSITGTARLLAQDVPIDVRRANSFSSGFAVAESPAFNILSVDGGAILRPTTVQELTTNLSTFMTDDGLSLPREVGVELSPGLLWSGPNLSLRDYRDRAWWYRTRVSFASKRPELSSTATQLAVGIRVTIEDGADLRTNDAYIRFVEAFHAGNLEALSALQDALVSGAAIDPETAGDVATALTELPASEVVERLDAILDDAGVTDAATVRAVEAVVDSAVSQGIRNRVDRTELQQFVDSLQNAAWNANSVDFAVAGLLAADDSTGANLAATQFNAWLTVGRRLGGSGQLLIGGAGVLADDPTKDGWDARAIASVRLYIGTNRVKLLTEGQFKLADERTWFLRGGTEFSPSFGGWFTLAAGIRGGDGIEDVALVTDFTFSLGFQHLLNSIR